MRNQDVEHLFIRDEPSDKYAQFGGQEDDMSRIIEIVSGLAATTIGLIGVATEVRALAYPYGNVQLATFPSGIGGYSWTAISSQINHFMFLLALLLVGLSAGAYLDAIYQSASGLALLWISTVSLTFGVGFATLTPPSFDYSGGSTSALALDVVPTALPVMTVVLAAVSAVAAITPLRSTPLPEWAPSLRRRLNRPARLHPPV